MDSETIVDFCRYLRDRGFHAGVVDTLSAAAVARTLGGAGITGLQHGLRAALCTSKEEWDAFDALFDGFLSRSPEPKPRPREPLQNAASFLMMNGAGNSSDRRTERDAKTAPGASLHERLSKADLADVKHEDQAALARVAQRLFQRAASRLSRRLKMAGRPATLDFRRTIRRSLTHGGEIIELRYRGRRQNKPSLVILLDVSGSMNPYSLFLLRFVHALQKQFRRTHTFVFSTRLLEITRELQPRDIAGSLKMLSATAVSWSGGTKIAECLQVFNAQYARKLLSRDSFFLILSDGWDTGKPGSLVAELRSIREKARKIIWLNPLLGLPEYRPETRAMAAALPYLDVFAPAHSIEALVQLEKHLCSMTF